MIKTVPADTVFLSRNTYQRCNAFLPRRVSEEDDATLAIRTAVYARRLR